jgi:hypothetical protein
MTLFYRFIAACLLLSPLPGLAQQTPTPKPASAEADTTGHDRYSYGRRMDRFYLGTLTKADGTEIQAFLPTKYMGYERDIEFFLPPLAFGDLRHRNTLKMKDLKAMSVHGKRYETVQQADTKVTVMALKVLDGPVALSVYAEPRAIPIPIPLGVGVAVPILGINIADKNHWYLLRNGVYTEMPKAHFAELMSAYLADNQELAGKIARQEANYLHANTPSILLEYNRAMAAGR